MDAASARHLEEGECKGRVLRGWSERGKISGTRPANCQRRARDREPHLLSSKSRARVAGACAPGTKRDAVADRNDHRQGDDFVSSTLRRRYSAVADERVDAAANRAGIELSRGSRKYRSAGLGKAGRGHHFATGETATPRRQHHLVTRRGRGSFANG